MGRGARSTVRWKHDRIRRKKARDARLRAAKAAARKPRLGPSAERILPGRPAAISRLVELHALVLGAGVLPRLVLEHPEFAELLPQPAVAGVQQAQLLQVGDDLGEQHLAELELQRVVAA